MSKKNKVIKLGSKVRNFGESNLVTRNGVEMTRYEREALIRAGRSKDVPSQPTGKKAKKGTKVAEPRHSKLFNLLHPNKKQTVVPNLKSVENTAPIVDRDAERKAAEAAAKADEEKRAAEMRMAEENARAEANAEAARLEAERKASEEKAAAEAAAKADEEKRAAEEAARIEAERASRIVDATKDDDDDDEDEDFEEEDDLTQELSVKNAKKRISPSFVKRVAKVSGKACDDYLEGQGAIDAKLADIEAQIKKAKTPKDATEERKAELNAMRKALRDQKKKVEGEKNIATQKAISLERTADSYCDIYELLTGKILLVRKTERLNPYIPLTEDEQNEVLNSLWAKGGARKRKAK